MRKSLRPPKIKKLLKIQKKKLTSVDKKLFSSLFLEF